MAELGAEQVILRNEFYRDNYHRVMLTLLLSVVINVALGGVLSFQLTHPPQPRYFATSINGRITPIVALNRPNQSEASVLQWANQAAIAAFSYNFVNYREELQAASLFFTPEGWRQFLQQLSNSNILDTVKAKKLIISAVAKQTPIILDKGVLNGRYSWRVQIRLLVTLQALGVFQQENYIVTMLITRVSTVDYPRGIGIAQFVVGPESGQPI